MIPLALHGTGFKMGPKLCFSNISFGGINQKKKKKKNAVSLQNNRGIVCYVKSRKQNNTLATFG